MGAELKNRNATTASQAQFVLAHFRVGTVKASFVFLAAGFVAED